MNTSIWHENSDKFRAELRKMRSEAGLTQLQLAEELSVPQSYVSKYEIGERRLDFLEVREVCNACGVGFATFARRVEKVVG